MDANERRWFSLANQCAAMVSELESARRDVAGGKLGWPGGIAGNNVPEAIQRLEDSCCEYHLTLQQATSIRDATGQDPPADPTELSTDVPSNRDTTTERAPHSSGYKTVPGSPEPIHIIEAYDLPFHLANVVKYICRRKGLERKSDLEKARWYLDRYLQVHFQ